MAKTKKAHFKSKYNWTSPKGETNNSPSKTVQGESYTIKELLEKHSTGLMPPVGLEPQYDTEEPTHDDSMLLRKQNLDLTDIDDLKDTVNKTKAKQSAIKKKEAEAKQSKIDKALEHYDRSSAGADETIKGDSAAVSSPSEV